MTLLSLLELRRPSHLPHRRQPPGSQTLGLAPNDTLGIPGPPACRQQAVNCPASVIT